MSQPGLETQADDPFGLLGREIEPGIVAERVVGGGGFGTVYHGRHEAFRVSVAIKVLRILPHISEHGKQHLRRKFEYEAQILSWLAGLTLNVPRPLSAKIWVAPNGVIAPYIVQEWLEGVALDTYIEKTLVPEQRYLGFERVFDLLDPVVETLRFAHTRVVHRDLKPSNIFLAHVEGQHRTKLLDFGISKIVGEGLASAGVSSVTGQDLKAFTPAYAAPEQWDVTLGEPSAQTDIFSFALVVLELLTLRQALAGETPQQLMFACAKASERSTPRKLGLEVPDATEALFARALSYQPSERPRSIDAWWIAIKESLALEPTESMSTRQRTAEPGLTGASAAEARNEPSTAQQAPPASSLQQTSLDSTQPSAGPLFADPDTLRQRPFDPPNFDDRTRIEFLRDLMRGDKDGDADLAPDEATGRDALELSVPTAPGLASRRGPVLVIAFGLVLLFVIAVGARRILLRDSDTSAREGAQNAVPRARVGASARLNATTPEHSETSLDE